MSRGERRIDYLCLQPMQEGQASYAHVNGIVDGLRRRGWRVRLVDTVPPRAGRFDALRRLAGAAGTQVRYWRERRFRPGPLLYVRLHFLTLPTALLAHWSGATVIQEVNGVAEDAYDLWPALRRLDPLIRWSIAAQLRWADGIIAVTAPLAEHVDGVVGRAGSARVIGNGADVDLFRPTEPGRAVDERSYVVFVGALASWQGIGVALEAAGRPEWPSDVGLVVVGDGRERDRVRAAAASGNRVRWLGTIPHRDVAPIVAGSLAALAPLIELGAARPAPSPMKLYEAMACGVPVVGSDAAGVGDVIAAHDCGLVFASGDAGDLARRVAELAADPARAAALGARGRRAAVESYSWDARAAQTESVIREASQARLRARRGRRSASA